MKKFILKIVSMAFICILSINPVMACTATPKADVSKPQPASKPSQYTSVEVSGSVAAQKEDTPFVIDNFQVIQNALCKLGIPNDELEVMIKEGKKLPEVLEMRNIEVAKFKKALLKQYYNAIDEGIKNKQITKEEGKMLRIAIKQKVMSWLAAK